MAKKLTIRQAVIKTLQARGETVVAANTTRYDVYTRKYQARRDSDGSLLPAAHRTFWFVSKHGPGMRVGRTTHYTMSVQVLDGVRDLLAQEGRALP